jgi:hypothetical protein
MTRLVFCACGGLVLSLFRATPVHAAPPSPASWEAGATASYVTSGDFSGYGAGGVALWLPLEWLAIGATVDVARLSASGVAPRNRRPFRSAFVSAYAGPLAQFRLPLGRFLPYADLSLGAVIAEMTVRENAQCSWGSGIDGSAGAGVKVALDSGLLFGLRASARLPGGSLGCNEAAGPWSFGIDPLLSLGATVDFRW